MPMKLLLQHRKGEKNGKLMLCTKTDMFIKTDMKKKNKVGKGPYFFFLQHPFTPCPPPIFFHSAFLKHNLPKVCACLVDFHFRCCQLKGIWTNQYLSVFWHTQSWLLEKSFLQQAQPMPLALALGHFYPRDESGTCPPSPPPPLSSSHGMSFGHIGQRALLYSFSFLHPDSTKNQ